MDEWTAWAVRTMVLDSDQEVTRWVEVLEQAYEAVQKEGTLAWDALAERVSAAEDVSSTALEAFVREVGDSGRGVELVADIVAERNRFPELYWELVAPAEEVAEDAADPLGWVSAEQRARLAEMWGESWAEYLPQQLEHRWGQGWEQHPDEHKTAWLDPLLAELVAEQSAPEPAAETVSAEQMSAAVVSAVAAVPGAEQLSEADMAEVMARVRASMEGAAR